MGKDILVNKPIERKTDDDFMVKQIEIELDKLEKKKKIEIQERKLREEVEIIENHIKNALQMQSISVDLAFQYRERLKKVSLEQKLFNLSEIKEMIDERRRKKFQENIFGTHCKVEEKTELRKD